MPVTRGGGQRRGGGHGPRRGTKGRYEGSAVWCVKTRERGGKGGPTRGVGKQGVEETRWRPGQATDGVGAGTLRVGEIHRLRTEMGEEDRRNSVRGERGISATERVVRRKGTSRRRRAKNRREGGRAKKKEKKEEEIYQSKKLATGSNGSVLVS